MTVGLIIMIKNPRILKENALQFSSSFLVSELPLIGSIPALTVIVWRMYHVQIKKETAALRKYESEHAASLQEERRQQAVEFMRARDMQIAQIQEQEAANDELYSQAANDEEIPDEEREAA